MKKERKNAEKINEEVKKNRKKLDAENEKEGLQKKQRSTYSNSKSKYNTFDEEWEERQRVVLEYLKVIINILPGILFRFNKIKDPRNPKSIKHKLSVVLLYGLIMFLLQMPSRRIANKEMTRPEFIESLKAIFPQLLTIPHIDTLFRLLEKIEVEEIQETLINLVKKLLRKKKFYRHKLAKYFVIALDGTEKSSTDVPVLSNEASQRNVNTKNGEKTQYFVYVLEANFVFADNLTIPLLTEFVEASHGDIINNKQDCESKALKRLLPRLKKLFPRLKINLLLDGLYSNGPAMELILSKKWDFMIVLQDNSLSSVWRTANCRKHEKNTFKQIYGDRHQEFWWVNNIDYYYGDNKSKKIRLNLVVCKERWKAVNNKTGKIEQKESKHAWISSLKFKKENVDLLCNKIARHRWAIENNILIEKHHGYEMKHRFSTDWNAMKGAHYLMRLAHLINILVHNTQFMFNFLKEESIKGLFRFLLGTLGGLWLDKNLVRENLKKKHQIRLR